MNLWKKNITISLNIICLQENDSKKARALKKADEERDSKKHKDKEIEK